MNRRIRIVYKHVQRHQQISLPQLINIMKSPLYWKYLSMPLFVTFQEISSTHWAFVVFQEPLDYAV